MSAPRMVSSENTSFGPAGSFLQRFLWPSWSQRKRMLRLDAWVLMIASYVLIALAYLWPQSYRNTSPPYVAVSWVAFMVRVFLFHLGLLLTLVAVIAALARNRRLALAALPLVLVTMGPTLWHCRPRSPSAIVGEAATVMSVNLLMVNRDTGPIIDEIRRADPDILLLQEYTGHWHMALRAAIGAEYPYERHISREDSFGTAIYAKRPFLGEVNMDLPLGSAEEPQIRAVVETAGRPVAIYNVHLLPPSGMEYTIETRRQFADLLDQLRGDSLPVIMGGDFNFTEATPQAAALARIGMLDAFDLGGWGRGTTWPVNSFFRWIPGIRLDHLYLSAGLTCSNCRTGEGRGSDHRPVIARVGFSR